MRFFRSTWLKVALLLLAIDRLVDSGPWLWRVPEQFYTTIDPRWEQAHRICSRLYELRHRRSHHPRVVIVGSSLVNFGVDEHVTSQELADFDGGVDVVKLTMNGAPATDVERIVRIVVNAKPALLIYMTAARDYPRKSDFDPDTTPLARLLYPPGLWLPPGHGKDAETLLTETMRAYWPLYRYRKFERLRLVWEARRVLQATGLRRIKPRSIRGQPQTPEDADRRISFEQFRGDNPVSLDLYLRWLEVAKGAGAPGYLKGQMAINAAKYGEDGNIQVEALRRLMEVCARHAVRLALIYAPVNPIIRDAETPYYDRGLADGYVALFQRLAGETGGTALDWRALHEVDDFIDFNHLNRRGRAQLSREMATLVRAELGGAFAASH